ncbi:hypothetical protein ABPG72_001157 [Tetrahymena utriculariae]
MFTQKAKIAKVQQNFLILLKLNQLQEFFLEVNSQIPDIPDEKYLDYLEQTPKKIVHYYFNELVNLLQDRDMKEQQQLKNQQIILSLVELGYNEANYLKVLQENKNQFSNLSPSDCVQLIIQAIEEEQKESQPQQEIKQININIEDEKSQPKSKKKHQDIKSFSSDSQSDEDEDEVSEMESYSEAIFNIKNIMAQKQKMNISEQQKQQQQQHANVDGKFKTCDICCNEKLENQFYIRQSCSHEICKTCIVDYLNFKIDNSQVEQIKCFNSNCKEDISSSEVESIMQGLEAKIQKYHRILNRNKILKNPNNKFCTKPDCEGYITLDSSSSQPFQLCNVCQTEICVKCFSQWHPRVSCSQNMEKNIQKYIEKNVVQLCPNCKIKIEKMTGCNHITCSFCKHEWCWLCKSKYSRSHFEKFNPIGCPGFYKQKQDWPIYKIYLYRFFCLIFWIFYCLAIPLLFFFYISFRYSCLFIKKKKYSQGCKKILYFTFGGIWFLLGPVLFPFQVMYYLYTIIMKNCKCCKKPKILHTIQRPRNSLLFNLSDQRSIHQVREIVNVQRRSLLVTNQQRSGSIQNSDQRSIHNASVLQQLQRLQQANPYQINRPYQSNINQNNLQNQDERELEERQDSPYPALSHFSPQRSAINIPRFSQSPQKLTIKNFGQNPVPIENKSESKDTESNQKKIQSLNLIQKKRERRRPQSLIGIKSIKTMDWKNQKFSSIQEDNENSSNHKLPVAPKSSMIFEKNKAIKLIHQVRSSQNLEFNQ